MVQPVLKLLGFFVSFACAAGLFGASPALITPRSADSLSAAGNSFAPTFSGGGRYVTFLSHANNLLTNGHRTPHLDLFVRDLETGLLDLISVSAAGTAGSQRDVTSFSVASNLQRIAFMTLATNLVATDNPRIPEIFIRDMLAQQTELGAVDISGEPLIN